MLTITCCRRGSRRAWNKHNRGAFTRKFNSISELALWVTKSQDKVYFPNILSELSKDQRKSLEQKLQAFYLKSEITQP